MVAVTQGARSGGRPVEGHDREAWRRLFAGIAEGRAEALEALYDLAVDRVHGLAAWRLGSAAEAADVVQDVFVRVAESREVLREVKDPRAWLLTVAHRISVDHARRRSRRRTVELDERWLVEPVSEDPTRRLEARAVTAALAALPDRLRVTVYLHHFAGCTFAETGRITGVPTFTAASRYRAGIRRLRKRLGETK
jgi:RNA polymerase sigma-70 factor (ECF subfamily)